MDSAAEKSRGVSEANSPASFDDLNLQIQAAALSATRNAVSLPSDISFHRSMDPELAQSLDTLSSRVLSITNKLLSLVATADVSQSGRDKGKSKLNDEDDILDNFHSLIVDSMDQLLERTDIHLDEYLGRSKPPAIAINPIVPLKQAKSVGSRLDPGLQHASHILKPQTSFKRQPDNSNITPWSPTIPHKYNAQVPLHYNFCDLENIGEHRAIVKSLHPYEYEIKHITYPPRMFQSIPPVPPKSFDDTPFTWIATLSDFHNMLEKLRQAAEIAVDLEHHDYRTFAGFLCLMQISTREEDWIVDTLLLRDELFELNEVFTNPKIVKVLHGAESDIVWLQQNFNLYVVNLFDTYHASRVLDFPRHGLANLLEMYCDFTPDKRYQLADWRIRPLPDEMLRYARSDTHFLLYIYDNLRNALLDRALSRAQSPLPSTPSSSPQPSTSDQSQSLVKLVLSRSQDTALRTYEKDIYDAERGEGPGGWDTLARKWNKAALIAGGLPGTGGLSREIYIHVHGWRDRVARLDDESTRYVLPNRYLFQLAEFPPKDMASLLSVFQSVPPVIRRRAKELLDVIQDCTKTYTARMAITAPSQPLDTVGSSPVVEDDIALSGSPIKETKSSNIWSHPKTSVFKAESSLFGSSSEDMGSRAIVSFTYAASRSSLFGTANRNISSMDLSSVTDSDTSKFQDLLMRIHSTLAILPSAPKITSEVVPNAIAPLSSVKDEGASTQTSVQQVEIAYVAPSQRQVPQVVDDSIVVVGQARQKKRKRVKPRTDEEDSGTAATGVLVKSEDKAGHREKQVQENGPDQQAFDYSAVPNILDDVPDTEGLGQRKKKKQKSRKSGVFEYGNFPAPPKAHSELKSGNQSHTFK